MPPPTPGTSVATASTAEIIAAVPAEGRAASMKVDFALYADRDNVPALVPRRQVALRHGQFSHPASINMARR
jgi:hypothetical protein